MLEEKIKKVIRDVEDFPKPGILFKDITPIMLHPELVAEITAELAAQVKGKVDVVCAVESRGFFFGPLIAMELGVPFIPIRKEGKLPGNTIAYNYDLEYGSATIEIHKGHLQPGQRVLVHDDLIATGGTVAAAAELVLREGGQVEAFSFLVNLSFLNGAEKLSKYNAELFALVNY